MSKLIVFLVFFVSACVDDPVLEDQQGVENQNSYEVTENINAEVALADAEPRLPINSSEAFPAIEKIAGFKDDGLPAVRSADSLSGGEIIHRMYDNGLLDVYTMSDGKLWRINVQSGIAERCGSRFSNKKAVQDFVAAITPDATPDVANRLFDALERKSIDEALFRSFRFTASGGCLQRLGVTQQGALPG